MTEATPSIEVTDKAKERLRAVLAREARPRVIRIDVGLG
jgi:Fe-S cluster assembly iron-binding protein IscA